MGGYLFAFQDGRSFHFCNSGIILREKGRNLTASRWDGFRVKTTIKKDTTEYNKIKLVACQVTFLFPFEIKYSVSLILSGLKISISDDYNSGPCSDHFELVFSVFYLLNWYILCPCRFSFPPPFLCVVDMDCRDKPLLFLRFIHCSLLSGNTNTEEEFRSIHGDYLVLEQWHEIKPSKI